MVQVDSEAMREILYDAGARILRIRFADGEWYRYYDVPSSEHERLLAAESHGRYFQAHIRGRYRYRRG